MCWCKPHAVQGSKFRVQVISDISIMYAKARAATRIFTLPPLCPWSSTATYNKKADYNLIGPPDPTSNIRPIKLKKPASKAVSLLLSTLLISTPLKQPCVLILQEEELQKLQLQIWAFNHGFWKRHNVEFQEVNSLLIQECIQVYSWSNVEPIIIM